MLTFFAVPFTVSRSSYFKIGRQDGVAAVEVTHLVPVRGDHQNTQMSWSGCVCGEWSSASNGDRDTLF